MLKYKELIIERFNHDTILVQNGLVFYFDPWRIDMVNMPRADVIFISHSHQDHCSPDDIEKIIKNDSLIIAPYSCQEILSKFRQTKKFISNNEQFSYREMGISTIPAYNLDKYRSPGQLFHAKEEGGVGYIVNIKDINLYFAGDTDNIPELKKLKGIDVAFLPISGTYVMSVEEALKSIKQFKPKIVVPIHYGSVVGDEKQAIELQELAKTTKIKILG